MDTKPTIQEEPIFDNVDLSEANRILKDATVLHSRMTANQHVTHCFWQLQRFSHQARIGKQFREGQFCFNLGRAQEILLSPGGVACWWRKFEPLIIAKQWTEIEELVKKYIAIFDLEKPPVEFLEKE